MGTFYWSEFFFNWKWWKIRLLTLKMGGRLMHALDLYTDKWGSLKRNLWQLPTLTFISLLILNCITLLLNKACELSLTWESICSHLSKFWNGNGITPWYVREIFRQLQWGTLTASFLDGIQWIIITDDFPHWKEFGRCKIQQSIMDFYRISSAKAIYHEFSLQGNFHSNIFKASALFETRVGLT